MARQLVGAMSPPSNLQDMIDQQRTIMQVESMAARLTLLKKQEALITRRTADAHMKAQELSTRRDMNVSRIRQKAENLRKINAAYHPELAMSAREHSGALQERMAATDNFGGFSRMPATARTGAADALDAASVVGSGVVAGSGGGTVAGSGGGPVKSEGSAGGSGAADGGAATNSGSAPKSQAKSMAQTTEAAFSHLHSVGTDDYMDLRCIETAAHARRAAAPSDFKMGVFDAYDASMLWMGKRGVWDHRPLDRAKPATPMRGRLADVQPEEILAKMTKKETELTERLRKAREAQEQADRKLEARFKKFSATQVSARIALRQGNYDFVGVQTS